MGLGHETTPIILVPGFWLGAWAWDEVAAALRADGHDVTALTLPGLESADADRSRVTLADHVRADQGRREEGLCVDRRPGRAARRDLRRPADEPLADVVTPARARRGHR